MKNYLVTGAAGFIGSKVASFLIKQGHKVVTIDNLTTGYLSNIPKGVELFKGDCQDENVLKQLKKWKFEAIFHLAGQSSGEVSFDNPVYDLQTNTQSTLQLLQLCVETGCNKFIYASSMSIYGDVDEKLMPVEELNILPSPKSFYGVGKLASENYLRIYSEVYGIAATSLRLFNVYGPGQNLENMRQGMVSIFVAQALRGNNIHVKGSSNRYRDLVYIDDVVKAFINAEIHVKSGKYLSVNICTGIKTTIEELIANIKLNTENAIVVKYEGSTPGDQFGIFGSSKEAYKTIKWKPKVGVVEGISKMMKWAKGINFYE